MSFITAIELENFQAIETRTRIEFKPITLLYGPNSAGKSAVFDAIELLRVLLDPTTVDESLAAEMVDRWARRRQGTWREMFLAVEFPFRFDEPWEVWENSANWEGRSRRSESPFFFFDSEEIDAAGYPAVGQTVRIELRIGVKEEVGNTLFHLVEAVYQIGLSPVLKFTTEAPTSRQMNERVDDGVDSKSLSADEKDQDSLNGGDAEDWKEFFDGKRWVEIFEETGFLNFSIIQNIDREQANNSKKLSCINRIKNYAHVNCLVNVALSPMSIADADYRYETQVLRGNIIKNAEDILFYFGTMLWGPMRAKAPVVRADRRSPRPEEALTVVDLGLKGWWSEGSMAPSSPAALLKTRGREIDEHFKGLAEAAHADLLLRTASADFWGGSHAKKHVEPVRSRAEVLGRVNHHLERSLFAEKLYRLECASTLMVPIDLGEDDPWSYYALAQPAAVRLFLREPSGQMVDLQDVGSGVSYVLPVLYAVSRQGLVQVQQPELHLHPALQASVADVFIEESHRAGFGQLLIETHSEHLLLRLLRRIRDTEKGKALSEDLTLTNEQLAVYYFDPRPEGGTFVSRQLVTPLGDFYNDWPRGFFSERNKDLFDEG